MLRGLSSNSHMRESRSFSPAGSSPSPTNLAAIDSHVDSGSDDAGDTDADADDDDEVADEDEDDADCVADDVDQVDSSGRVLNDGDELLDDPPFEEKQQPHGGHRAAALTNNSLGSSFSSSNLDGSRRIWLCPSKYGRPSTVYFDYPAEFGMKRSQPKVPCDKPCVLRFKHADSACIYNSVTGSLKRGGFIEQVGTSKKEQAQFNLRYGKHMLPDAFKELKSYQKVNHFPGTGGIGRKDRLARNINKSRRLHGGAEYNFLPETYLLPADRSLWEMKFNNEPPGTLWISKPNSSSCGRGIKMVSKLSDIPPKRSCVVSRYVSNPLLVSGRKFDLRIYVLVTSFHPLKVYLYNNGLARFCTEKYDLSKKNLKKKYIHLTNFSVNKKSKNFIKNNNDQNLSSGDDGGDSSKWSLLAFKKYLLGLHGPARCAEVWSAVNDIFIKTLLSVETNVSSNIARLGGHREQCYELYGFDILLDANLKPFLIEVNCAPSLSSSSPLDKRIKNELLTDVFHTIGIKPAYIKDKDKDKDAAKEKASPLGAGGKNQKAASSSERAGRTSSSSRAGDAGVVRGGTMGPSNSRASRTANGASPLSPINSASSPAGPTASDGGGGTGGRVGKIKSAVLHSFFSSLSKADLTLLREFRDEIDRAESGGWRLIFPIGGAALSYDAYAHLFEVEKYEDLLLMLFQKHFGEASKERICQGKAVEPHEVLHSPEARTSAPSKRVTTAGGSPTVSGSGASAGTGALKFPSRPSTVALTGTNLTTHPQVVVQTHPTRAFSAAATPSSPSHSHSHSSSSSFSSASPSPLSGLGGVAATHSFSASSEQDMNRRQMLSASATSSPARPTARPVAVQRFLAEKSSHAAPAVQQHSDGGLTGLEEPLESVSLSDDENVAPASSSPFSSSPEDSEADELGRPVRRYFAENGVALQPFMPHAPQYHDAHQTDDETIHALLRRPSGAQAATRSPPRTSRPVSALRTQSLQLSAEHGAIPSASSSSASSFPAHTRSLRSGARRSTGMIGLEGARSMAQAQVQAQAQQQQQLQQQQLTSSPFHFARPLSSTLTRFTVPQAQPTHAHTKYSNRYAASGDEQPLSMAQQHFGFSASLPPHSGRVHLQQHHPRVSQPGAFTPTGPARALGSATSGGHASLASSSQGHPTVADSQFVLFASRRAASQTRNGSAPAFARLTG